jgi:hypothetical protein
MQSTTWYYVHEPKYEHATTRVHMSSDALPSPLLDPKGVQITQTAELWRTRGTFPALNTKRSRGVCWSFGMGLGRVTSFWLLSLKSASNQPQVG